MSNITRFSIPVSHAVGHVSAILQEPSDMSCVMTLAHGAGAGMEHKFMVALADELANLGIGTLRYNFPYMESGKRRPDVPAVAMRTVESALDSLVQRFPELPVFASGKSFGGRMSSNFLARSPATSCKGVVFFGFPLHPAKKPATDRANHLNDIALPMLFLQGTKDELAEAGLIEAVGNSLPTATVIWFEKADHAFYVPKKNIIPELAQATKNWTDLHL